MAEPVCFIQILFRFSGIWYCDKPVFAGDSGKHLIACLRGDSLTQPKAASCEQGGRIPTHTVQHLAEESCAQNDPFPHPSRLSARALSTLFHIAGNFSVLVACSFMLFYSGLLCADLNAELVPVLLAKNVLE